ncbi:MAG TPA: Uma2 family endonuclease [Chloroflexota bacterium]|nr:Uma2 family endonuclease [Chloroflexota bacterium]
MTTRTMLPFSEYLKLPEDDPQKYEMIEGELYAMPQPRFKHQRVAGRLMRLLDEFVDSRQLGRVCEPINLYQDEVNYVHPDISYFTAAQAAMLEEELVVRLPPPLVVEVLSPSTAVKDRDAKRCWYANLGVQEYWLVDADREVVEVIDLRSGMVQQTDPVRSSVLVGLELQLARIFS